MLLTILPPFSWVSLVHVVRAEFLRARNFEYVNAALSSASPTQKSSSSTCCRMRWWRPSPSCRSSSIRRSARYLARLSRARHAVVLAVAGRAAAAGQVQSCRRRGSGLSAFAVTALMLSLLIFIGEAVRDAFDPKSNLCEMPPRPSSTCATCRSPFRRGTSPGPWWTACRSGSRRAGRWR